MPKKKRILLFFFVCVPNIIQILYPFIFGLWVFLATAYASW